MFESFLKLREQERERKRRKENDVLKRYGSNVHISHLLRLWVWINYARQPEREPNLKRKSERGREKKNAIIESTHNLSIKLEILLYTSSRNSHTHVPSPVHTCSISIMCDTFWNRAFIWVHTLMLSNNDSATHAEKKSSCSNSDNNNQIINVIIEFQRKKKND